MLSGVLLTLGCWILKVLLTGPPGRVSVCAGSPKRETGRQGDHQLALHHGPARGGGHQVEAASQ